ncbi:MAG: hypothetical protein IJQ15_00955, partial [Synergistaceae bacterium]|nr:hypothetical protein [Synergistaceae bacterium]
MREIFERYQKAIITGGGVIIFIIAGLLTMLFTDSKNLPSETKPVPQNQPKIQPAEVQTPQPPKILFVYITGEIRKPGVYKLSE